MLQRQSELERMGWRISELLSEQYLSDRKELHCCQLWPPLSFSPSPSWWVVYCFVSVFSWSVAQSSQSPFFLSLSNQDCQVLMSFMTSSITFLSLFLISLVKLRGGLVVPLTSHGTEGNCLLPVSLF